ncbi:uncharacterized protein AC631_01754 [Debaryomyces fabryi]|uniref:Splicing factor YJU2 n=1 Tax=Debaryomyces fabryi TaxID=58627 RepID=A0A0V1Q1V0_9ASCO|nr:uncharacterized protein AC631_01754 [Debaryomyces fabryi]KSA02481.1 hypothetical protein AC631_01754 [Debaryomyces fabryi]CUM50355.1 unnamed protein product [Debaryomyces fabryi]
MSERKGINKYYPPDWDPSKVPKKKKPANQIIKVRLMAPYSMRCTKCNEYISERRKFNAKKEVTNEKYMNFKIIRFHITCPKCNNNITYKTNPQTAGYVPESGAVRNYEPESNNNTNKIKVETEEQILERLEREEKENNSFQLLKEKRKKNPFWQQNESLKDQKGDLMENLEKRLQDQQRQQEITDHLEYLQAKNSLLQAKGGRDQALNEAREKVEKDIELMKSLREDLASKEDEELAKDMFKKFRLNGVNGLKDLNNVNKETTQEESSSFKRTYENALQNDHLDPILAPAQKQSKTIILKKKQPLENHISKIPIIESKAKNTESLSGALGDYSSSDEE